MIKGFRQYTEQKLKPVVFTFGRFNPPTTGHLKLLDKVASIAKGNNYKVYASQSNNPKKDPLQYKEKIGFMRKMFPKHGRNIVMSPKIKTVFDIASELYDEGFNKIIMVVGGDRVKEFDSLLKKYNGVKGRHGFYNFVEGIEVVSAGERDPDAEGVTGMSASKMRKAAVDGDFKSFQNGLPKGYSDGTKLFNTLRKRMGIKEITNFRKHVQLDTISEKRERYSRGEIFNIGEEVFTESGKLIIIEEKKPNYVVDTDGNKYWISDLQEARKVAQDKDVGKKKGTQPKKYYKGLAKSTKSKRDAHFKKGAKMDDDNPAAYKPAPGDTKGKTKPSKYTTKFKKMFGEDSELMEKLITFGNKAYPKQGHALILAGGAGSGKGFVLDNLIGLEGKVFNVDDLKSVVMRTPKIVKKIKDKLDIDMSKMDLKKGEDVAKLHDIVANELNLSNKQQVAFFANVLFQKKDLKPNVIFDVTLKDLRKLESITRLTQSVGYPKENIHIVWVVNDIEVAKKQNVERPRQVPVEILINTHRGASQTMLDIMNMGKKLRKYMDGDIVYTFNKVGVDSSLVKGKKGGSYIKDANYVYVKKSGKPPTPVGRLGKDLLKKIQGYVPNANTWAVTESKHNPRIPRKKGQPAGSKKHSDLYTDENPKGTIKGLGFKDVETAKASVKKIENSGKTHAHKIQAAIAMEQRARVMGKKSEAAVYRKYINKMKKKTKERQKKETFQSFKEYGDNLMGTDKLANKYKEMTPGENEDV